jgi:hypothetical protein
VGSHLTLAKIGDSLPLEVPIDVATLYKFARDSEHKADNDFRALEEGSKARARLFYENSKS